MSYIPRLGLTGFKTPHSGMDDKCVTPHFCAAEQHVVLHRQSSKASSQESRGASLWTVLQFPMSFSLESEFA